jgi:gamma-glutamyltranspeptidase/glutathione hydrolase
MINYNANMDFNSRRSPVVGKNGMVATSQPLAVAAGLEILEQGGNAADAAVATAAALNVTEPTSTGIGGDCFALFYQASTRKVHALNASGRSPSALTLQKTHEAGFTQSLPYFHPNTITIPGAASGWNNLIGRFGSLPLGNALAPAIELAERGFPVAPITAYFWGRGAERQLSQAPNGHELTIDGRAPKPGEIFKNPGLAKTFRMLADGGAPAFYHGEIAEAIVKVIKDAGGFMSIQDLADHSADWVTPISTYHNGYRVWECPPNGQGLATLLALNILEHMDLVSLPLLSTKRLHLMIEAMRLAFADTRWYVADPEHSAQPIDLLLSKEYAQRRAGLINPDKATIDQQRGTPTSGSDTVYLTVVDKEGNACSFINSNYMGFGTGFVPKGWGFTLQNRGHGFSLDPDHPNALGPSKRPYHTIIPSMVTHEESGELFASFGVMGGFMQPQGHTQVALSLINRQLDPQSALDLPRFCITNGEAGGQIALENGITFETLAELSHMGHQIQPTTGHNRALFGRGQIILKDRETAVLWGGSDPRADGLAMTMP